MRPLVLNNGFLQRIPDTAALQVPSGATFPGSPVQGDQYVLTGDGLSYVFNGSVWVPSGVASSPSQGFQTNNLADYYGSTSTGLCPGADDFIATVLVVPFQLNLAKVELIVDNTQGASGWRIFWSYGNIEVDVYDGTGSVVACNVSTVSYNSVPRYGDMHVITLRCRQVSGATEVSAWVGSAHRGIQSSTQPNVTPGTSATLKLGSGALFGEEFALNGGIYGLGYYEGTVTDDELRTLQGLCAAQGTIPLTALPWDNVYLGSSFASVPTTVSPTIGSGTFTKQGSPTGSTAFFPTGAGGHNVITVSGGGGSSSTTGSSDLDFGSSSTSSSSASLVVTGQTAITSLSSVRVWVNPIATADHSVDEHILEPLRVFAHSIDPGVGFTITGVCDTGATYGTFSIAWEWK